MVLMGVAPISNAPAMRIGARALHFKSGHAQKLTRFGLYVAIPNASGIVYFLPANGINT